MIQNRKLTASGNSVVVTAPKLWLEYNNLKAGDEVLMIMMDDLRFKVIKEGSKWEKKECKKEIKKE